MTLSKNLAAILMAASAGGAAYAQSQTEVNQAEGQNTQAPAYLNDLSMGQGGSASNNYTVTTPYSHMNIVGDNETVLHLSPVIYTKGFLTDTIVSSRVIEITEDEATISPTSFVRPTESSENSTNTSTNQSIKIEYRRVTNLYLDIEKCEIGFLRTVCEGQRSKILAFPPRTAEAAP